MKILVTGSNGQLGSEIRVLAPGYPQLSFVHTDVAELDICDREAVERLMDAESPDVVINCAAYTAVDRAEQEPEGAWRLNATAPGILAGATRQRGALLVHISTDYVFDGKNYVPYVEEDPVCPVSSYGKSKLAGEEAVKELAGRALIIRTSWLYSSFGHNFVKTILRAGRERGHLRVVFDQTGSPTCAKDLARALLDILSSGKEINGVDIYHYSNEGVASWYDFAIAILEFGNVACTVEPIGTADYPTPAIRPPYSVFNKRKIKQGFDLTIPYWRDSLRDTVLLLRDTEPRE